MMRIRVAPESFVFTVMLGLLAALPPLSIDINAPTLLAVQREFGQSPELAGLSITLFMVGFATGQFGAGPLSDRSGRRPLLLCGLSAYIVSAAGCALAGSLAALLAWRLLQGIAAGSCTVMAFAIIRDLFDGDAGRVKRSYVIVVFSLAPLLAPSLGAAVLAWAGWRPVYWVLCVAGTVLLISVSLCVPESLRPGTTAPTNIRRAYKSVLGDRRFLGVAVVNALSYGGLFAYIAGSPQVVMGSLGLSARTYGLMFACTAAALTSGAWVSGWCARRGVRPRPLLWVGLATAAATAVGLAALLMSPGPPEALLMVVLVINVFSRGLVSPNAQHVALEPLRDQAGTAAASLGVMQILTGAASSALVFALLPWLKAPAMAFVMAALAVASLTIWVWITQPSRVEGFVVQDAD